MDNRNTLEEMKRQAELVAQVKEHGIESLMEGPSIPLQSKQETQSVTNEGASTATLEELEKMVRKNIEERWPVVEHSKVTEQLHNANIRRFLYEFFHFLKPHLSALLKQKDEKYFEVENDFKIFRELYQKEKLKAEELQSQLTNSREEAIGFAVWMRDNEALVIAENEKTIGWEEMTYDWFYSLYLQSKTEQTNPIK